MSVKGASQSLRKDEIEKIKKLRDQGWSYDRIGAEMGISKTTAKKYAPGGKTIPLPSSTPQAHAARWPEKFTPRQIEIAIAAAEYRRKNKLD